MKESEVLKGLLEGQTIIVITAKKVGSLEIEPMQVVEKVNGPCIITNEGTYTDNKNTEIDYHERSITVRNVGENVISRTFVVLNQNPRKGRHYNPYPSTEESSKWLAAEEASWNWSKTETPT